MQQWRLRWRAQRLWQDLQSIQVGNSSAGEANTVLTKSGEIQSVCRDNEKCYSQIRITMHFPQVFSGSWERDARNYLPKLIDCLGIRSSGVGAAVISEHGVVTEKSFYEEVNLPVRDWYLRGGAYVPSLAVSSSEALQFRETEQALVVHSDPLHYADRVKGPYGIRVKFLSKESPEERNNLMAFRFSCITQLLPCKTEDEILPSVKNLLRDE